MKKVNTVHSGMGAVVGLDLSDKKGTYVVLSWREACWRKDRCR